MLGYCFLVSLVHDLVLDLFGICDRAVGVENDEKAVKLFLIHKGEGESIKGVPKDHQSGWRQIAPIKGAIGRAKERADLGVSNKHFHW